MNKIDHYIGLNSITKGFTDKLHKELEKEFAGNKLVLEAIEKDKQDFTSDYSRISVRPDEERAIRIAQRESCSILYANDVVELIVRVCRLTHATAKGIVKAHFSPC
jgi:hypothetical protein